MRVVVIALLASTVLAAQADDPCALPMPTTYPVQRADVVRVGFCHVPELDDGTPIPLGTTHFYVIDATTGALLQDFGLLVPVQAAAEGNYYYEGPARTYAIDVVLAIVADYQGLQAASPAIVVDVRGGPKAPTQPRLN